MSDSRLERNREKVTGDVNFERFPSCICRAQTTGCQKVSVCSSVVRLSHAGIMLKRLNSLVA